jgi:hypothetical protein
MLEGHDASGDVFITAHWRELRQMFPNSKFVLNTRNVEDWLASQRRIPGFWRSEQLYDRYHRLTVYGTHDVEDQATLRAAWERHHREVEDTIAKHQLLVLHQPFEWEPLCRFLGVPVPEQPFPWKNRKTNTDAVVRDGCHY